MSAVAWMLSAWLVLSAGLTAAFALGQSAPVEDPVSVRREPLAITAGLTPDAEAYYPQHARWTMGGETTNLAGRIDN